MKPQFLLSVLGAVLVAGIAPAEPMSLDAALARALEHNPELKAASHALRAADARTRQAGVFPNPELEVEVEEYDRNGEGFDSSEAVLSVGQAIELGGKRGARKRAARLELELARWDLEAARLETYAETRTRFVMALAAQQRAELADITTRLAEETAQAVQERVKAGREPPLQASKARAELEMARMDRQEADRQRLASQRNLSAMWGQSKPDFELLTGELHALSTPVPPLDLLQEWMNGNPDLARWNTLEQLQDAAVDAAKAARIPDLEARVGFQRFEEDGSDALAFGLGIPLPLFDRNQGEIAAQEHAKTAILDTRHAAELALRGELADTHAQLTTARERASVLGNSVVPTIEDAFIAAQEGYRQGKLGYLDVLDAQRSLADARQHLLEALTHYHLSLATLDRLTAQPTLNSETEQ